jgi:hypothetical protein
VENQKRILVFSGAAGRKQLPRRIVGPESSSRVHYLLEPGRKSDFANASARINYTNQTQTLLFRPIRTGVKAEERFLSIIARRFPNFRT